MIAALLGGLLAIARPGTAQELSGRVVRADEGAAGVPVTLHRVTKDSSGVVAQTRTGARGDFRFALPPAAASGFTVYFATAEWQGERYFGPPLHPNEARSGYAVEVFDTAGVRHGADPVHVTRRDVIMLPEDGESWEVNEVLRIENAGRRTLVAPEGLPTWEFRIPRNASAFEVGEGGIGSDRIVRMGDRVLITASLQPGSHDVVVRYRVPTSGSRLAVQVADTTREINMLVREPAPRLRVEGLNPGEAEEIAGDRFQRYSATGIAPGAKVTVTWRGPLAPPVPPIWAAVGAAGLVLAGGAGLAVRGRRPGR